MSLPCNYVHNNTKGNTQETKDETNFLLAKSTHHYTQMNGVSNPIIHGAYIIMNPNHIYMAI